MLPVRRDDHEPQAAQEKTLNTKRQKDCVLVTLQHWAIPTSSLQTFAVPSLRFHRLTNAGWPQVWEAYPSSPYPLALLLVPDWPPEREGRGASPEHPDYAGSRSPEGRSGIERERISDATTMDVTVHTSTVMLSVSGGCTRVHHTQSLQYFPFAFKVKNSIAYIRLPRTSQIFDFISNSLKATHANDNFAFWLRVVVCVFCVRFVFQTNGSLRARCGFKPKSLAPSVWNLHSSSFSWAHDWFRCVFTYTTLLKRSGVFTVGADCRLPAVIICKCVIAFHNS